VLIYIPRTLLDRLTALYSLNDKLPPAILAIVLPPTKSIESFNYIFTGKIING
jgi:hypothetical protein